MVENAEFVEEFSEPDPLEEAVEAFLECRRRGEEPSIGEYVEKFPDQADELRELLSAVDIAFDLGREEPDSSTVPVGAPTRDGQPLRRLGEYAILREVGRGGMGVVYEARQESLGRHVALKVLPFNALADPKRRERFRREARAAASLHHTNIVPVYGVGEEEGICFYVMQFIQGHGLDEILREVRRLRDVQGGGSPEDLPSRGDASSCATSLLSATLPLTGRERQPAEAVGGRDDRPKLDGFEPVSGDSSAQSSSVGDLERRDLYFYNVARIGQQVAEALSHAHGQGVLHRDVKPSNLLLDAQGTVWVTDFGLAKAEGGDDLTQTGEVLGTLRYMAPERFSGWSDPRSDVYGLGITLYELATLEPAFSEGDRARLMERVKNENPPLPHRLEPGVSRDLETIILKAIEKEPGRRYPTAVEFADDLRAFLEDRPIRARRARAIERGWRWCRRNPALASVSAAAAVLLAVIAAVLLVAARIDRERGVAVRETERAEQATRQALFWSHHANARSGRQGEVFRSLEFLGGAAERQSPLAPNTEETLWLRNEVIACVARVDLRRTDRQLGIPPGSYVHAFDADFSRYARADREGNVSVRRSGDDEEIERRGATESKLRAVRLSPDGRFLATRHGEGVPRTVILRDLELDDEVLRVASGPGIDFSADGRRVVLGRSDSSLGVYELPSGELLGTFALPKKSACESVSFHPDGKRVAFILRDAPTREIRTVHLLDLESMQVDRTLKHRSRVRGLAWHPNGRFLATGCLDMNIYVWDSSTGSLLEVLKGHEAEVVRVLFSPAGDLLASYSWDNTVRLWEPLSGRLLVTTSASGLDLQFSRDGESLALLPSPSSDMASHVWQVAHGRVLRTLHGHSRAAKGPFWVDVSPDGALLASTGYDGVRLWSLSESEELHHLPLPLAEYSSALFGPSGRVLITSTVRGLQRWPYVLAGSTLRVGPPKSSGPLATRELERASLAADGRTLAVIDSRTRAGLVYDLEGEEEKRLGGNHRGLATIDISADGRWVAAGTRGVSPGATSVWDARSGDHVKDLSGGNSRVKFGPLGRWLVVSHPEKFRFYEAPSWELHHELGRPRPWGGVAGPMAFTKDGRILALAYSRNLVRLVDPSTGHELASLEAPAPRNIRWLAFSPDGGRLAVATGRNVIQVWDLRRVRERLGDMGLDWDPQRRESRTPR